MQDTSGLDESRKIAHSKLSLPFDLKRITFDYLRDIARDEGFAPRDFLKVYQNNAYEYRSVDSFASAAASASVSASDVSKPLFLRKEEQIPCDFDLIVKMTAQAENKAAAMTKKYLNTLQGVSEYYGSQDFFILGDSTKLIYAHPTAHRLILAQSKTWKTIKLNLDIFRQQMRVGTFKHNSLGQLLLTSDLEFVDLVSSGRIVISDEIGLLLIQRLRDIAFSPLRTYERTSARKSLQQQMNLVTNPVGPFFCHENALLGEITKLILHAQLNPGKKTVWIGTARAVNAAAKVWSGEAIYLNPISKLNTWALNRGWLEAAITLGYEVKLVEQHFPDIEEAILSQDPSKFLTQLAYRMRPEGAATSQYDGGFSPTATSQEILALMEIGAKAIKNKDASISFVPDRPSCIDSIACAQTNRFFVARRRHSCPNTCDVSTPPPLDQTFMHFSPP